MRVVACIALIGALLAACADDPPDAVSTTVTSTSSAGASSSTSSTTTSSSSSTTTAVAVTVPPGIVSASLYQYRLDWAKGVVQARIRNDTDRRFKVIGVQFVWPGLTTPVAVRADTVVPGQSIDFPVTLVDATCADGGMPSISSAVVRLQLDDGTEIDALVTDPDGVAAGIYLRDCERQMIERMVTIEWDDLHETVLDGRPVTDASLRLRRGEGDGTITVSAIGNTILYRVESPDGSTPVPLARLDAADDDVSVPVRFVENRCDAHARAESSQSFRFFADIDLGDGIERTYEVLPTADDQVAMRARLDVGCAVLGDTGFLGQDP